MMYTTSPRFNYEKHLDLPVVLRLVKERDRENDYYLQFRIAGPHIIHPWHTVRRYVRTTSAKHYPGEPGEYPYGMWAPYWFKARSPEEGQELIKEFKSKIRTVRDIYDTYINKGMWEMAADVDAYREFRLRHNALPRIFQ